MQSSGKSFSFSSKLKTTQNNNNGLISLQKPNAIVPYVSSDSEYYLTTVNKLLNQSRSFSFKKKVAMKVAVDLLESNMIDRLHNEVDRNYLALRSDRNIISDISLQEEFLCLLFNYELEWLKVGLEVVFGINNIAHESSKSLRTIILKNFLSKNQNPDVNSTLKSKHQLKVEQINKNFIVQFFYFVLLLDITKTSTYNETSRDNEEEVEHTIPSFLGTLFHSNAVIKSSKNIIYKYVSLYIKSEGDIFKRIELFGYCVNYQQNLLNEYNYEIKNLSNDLRNGICLTRLIEIKFKDYSLTSLLRCPAISRLQKIHNIHICLAKLFENSNESEMQMYNFDELAKNVVDGDNKSTTLILNKIVDGYGFDLKSNEQIQQLIHENCNNTNNIQRKSILKEITQNYHSNIKNEISIDLQLTNKQKIELEKLEQSRLLEQSERNQFLLQQSETSEETNESNEEIQESIESAIELIESINYLEEIELKFQQINSFSVCN